VEEHNVPLLPRRRRVALLLLQGRIAQQRLGDFSRVPVAKLGSILATP